MMRVRLPAAYAAVCRALRPGTATHPWYLLGRLLTTDGRECLGRCWRDAHTRCGTLRRRAGGRGIAEMTGHGRATGRNIAWHHAGAGAEGPGAARVEGTARRHIERVGCGGAKTRVGKAEPRHRRQDRGEESLR